MDISVYRQDIDNRLRLLHLHECPVCLRLHPEKVWLLTYGVSEAVMKVPATEMTRKRYGEKVLWNIANFEFVHGPSCKKVVMDGWENPDYILLDAIKVYIGKSSGYVKRLQPVHTDDYRSKLMRMCGLDPEDNFRVYKNEAIMPYKVDQG